MIRVGVYQSPGVSGKPDRYSGPPQWVEIDGVRLPEDIVLSVKHEADAQRLPEVTLVLQCTGYTVVNALDRSPIEGHGRHRDEAPSTALDVLAVLADRTDSLPEWAEPMLAPYRRLPTTGASQS